ncbi:hypothetical protein CWE12_09295 [Aliidiomarina sedimenti]|uniref:DUF3313 domain-containing protein n=1 Tax=Aliidiomarina sedimenti TaxID=1933879 RepID=A0ABY0BXM3_9GAMM|nr:hypothetical protein [Aliidiomarina sedimenti]RUO29172.1 hypothetical protein CWE12_09295 [Aliidiomarina sedimenti]
MVFFTRLLVAVLSCIVLPCAAAEEPSTDVTLLGQAIEVRQTLSSEWMGTYGTDGYEDVTAYGIRKLAQDTLWMPAATLQTFTRHALLNQFATDIQSAPTLTDNERTYVLHLYSQADTQTDDEQLTGFSLVTENSENGQLNMHTYQRVDERFVRQTEFSDEVRGALDCESAALMALTFSMPGTISGSGDKQVKVVTLGRMIDEYDSIESETQYLEGLQQRSRQLLQSSD